MEAERLQQLVSEAPMLQALTGEEVKRIIDNSRVLRADKGAVILHEGQPGHGIFLILNGMVTVRRQVFGGFPVFANLYKNEVFGEIGLLTDQPAGATVIAGTECWLLLLPTDTAQRMMKEGDAAIYKLLREVVATVQTRMLGVVGRMVEVFQNAKKHVPVFERMYQRMNQR